MSLRFNRFALSESAIMYVYNDDHTMLLGPITSRQNNKQGIYGTSPLGGSSIHLLVVEKSNESKKPISQVAVSSVIVGYRDIGNSAKKKAT